MLYLFGPKNPYQMHVVLNLKNIGNTTSYLSPQTSLVFHGEKKDVHFGNNMTTIKKS